MPASLLACTTLTSSGGWAPVPGLRIVTMSGIQFWQWARPDSVSSMRHSTAPLVPTRLSNAHLFTSLIACQHRRASGPTRARARLTRPAEEGLAGSLEVGSPGDHLWRGAQRRMEPTSLRLAAHPGVSGIETTHLPNQPIVNQLLHARVISFAEVESVLEASK